MSRLSNVQNLEPDLNSNPIGLHLLRKHQSVVANRSETGITFLSPARFVFFFPGACRIKTWGSNHILFGGWGGCQGGLPPCLESHGFVLSHLDSQARLGDAMTYGFEEKKKHEFL